MKIHISSGAVGPKKAEIQDLNRTTQTGQNEEYDIIFPGLFYFPENRECPVILSNFPGIPGKLIKAGFP